MKKRRRSQLNQVVDKPLYFKVDKKNKKLASTQQLQSRKSKLLFLALVFEDQSYVIIDQSGHPVEYSPAKYTYQEGLSCKKWKLINEEPIELSRWINRKEDIPVLIEEKRSGKELANCWVGLPEERFLRYKKWATPSGYLCGTYAAAVLLAYYQDYRKGWMLPNEIRKKNTADSLVLTKALRSQIQPLGLPTIPFQVSTGISSFLKKNGNHERARATLLGSWQRATKRIREGKPVMIGILKVLGSTYGNHWVTAYAYFETETGERYYKVHDNWGDYHKVIPASWSNGTVSLP
ncbi:dihydrolipoamide dehydrogenase [Enterococcus faecium]|uniref:dihydrolipoamide dehydrogenase n=1 Tax=Enterococcus faecium TaxID=1352 RepID=UPI001560E7B6|nr:dihydrolipoamide dehydrogenase [Enterococcus faecium]MBH1350443.1 dihydrolipoamide dehydrogenase [Enterococcus faecium]NRE59227.1 dihydrolipoamide dehydrogenase [Enterococcus faecium]